MSEYGSGVGMYDSLKYDKERIIHALNGELACDETEEGFVYAPASKEECDAYIVSAFNNAVYLLHRMNIHAHAMEKIEKKHGLKYSFTEYNAFSMLTEKELDDKIEFIHDDEE